MSGFRRRGAVAGLGSVHSSPRHRCRASPNLARRTGGARLKSCKCV